MDSVTWKELRVKVSDLKPYERNPRQITEGQFIKLKESIEQDGYHSRIKINTEYKIAGGHQRLQALKELGYEEIEVLYPSRELTNEEFERILIRDNHNNGMFDMDMLGNNYDLEFLRDMGIHEIMNIAPEEKDDSGPGKRQVKCPCCGETFPTKGNAA